MTTNQNHQQPITTPKRPASGGEMLGRLLVAGVGLLIVGFVIAAVAMSGTTSTAYSTESTGSEGGFLIGLLLAGLGGILTQVWAIAWGVSIGGRVLDDHRRGVR